MINIIRTFVKAIILFSVAVPILLDARWRRKAKIGNKEVPSIEFKGQKIVTYFDRQIIDGTADAGAKTILESMGFLKNKKGIMTRYVLLAESAGTEFLSVSREFSDGYSFTIRQAAAIRNLLLRSDFVFVKTPENLVVLYLLLLFSRSKPIIWYYGGDIYSLRYKTALSGSTGINFFSSFLKYSLYSAFERLMWPMVDFCLSPNQDEANIIKRFNERSLVLPVRIFDNLDVSATPDGLQGEASDTVALIFVGRAGHEPNINALRYSLTDLFPVLKEECLNPLVLHVVGAGWDSPRFSDWLRINDEVVLHGRISDHDLGKLYDECMFALAPVQDGAGVKGKVIEAMYNKKIVITTSIGAQGISSSVLPVFDEIDGVARYVNSMIRSSDARAKTTSKYHEFLAEFYSESVYERLFSSLLFDGTT